MHDSRYPVVPQTHPYTLAINQTYDLTLNTGKVMTATYRGANNLGFWVVVDGSTLTALNPAHVVSFSGATT